MPRIPLFRPSPATSGQREALSRVLESGIFLEGRETEEFERRAGAFLGAKPVVSCHSGTDALLLALKAAGVGAGDEVIVPSLTAVPTVAAILLTGAQPVFADVCPERWVMDEAQALSLIGPKTKAVLPVHLYGNVVDAELLARSGVAVVEDAAQAFGSFLRGMPAGTMGRFGAFSLYPTKNLGAPGDGGLVACSNDPDAICVRELKAYGCGKNGQVSRSGGMNSRLGELEAAYLNMAFPGLDVARGKKQAIASLYREELGGLPLRFQRPTEGADPFWHLFAIQVEDPALRDPLRAELERQGIQTKVHYPFPCHRQFPRRGAALPVTETLVDGLLSLPFFPGLSLDEASIVARAVRGFLDLRT